MPKSPVSAFAAAAASTTPSLAPVTAPKTKPTPVKAVKPNAPSGGPVLKRANAGTSHGLQRMHHVVNS